MTDGIASTSDAERSIVPPTSSCTTSAFSPSTRHTARRRPTVVRGSYVTLSSNTRRTPPPAWVCSAKHSLTGTTAAPNTRRTPVTRMRPRKRPPVLGAHQCLAVFADRAELAVPPGHRVPQGPGRAHHDLRAVLARHAEHGVAAQPE